MCLRRILLYLLGCLLIGYFASSKYYEFTQHHLFDPYYQTPLPIINTLPKEINKKHFRILVIGGSTTANRFLSDSLRFTNLLQNRLNDNDDSTVFEVINCGMDWHTVKHASIAYITEYRSLKPDFVFVFHGINDLYRSFSPDKYAIGGYRADYSHFYGSAINGANPPSFEKYLYNTFFENVVETYLIKRNPTPFALSEFSSLSSYKKYLTHLTEVLVNDRVNVCLLTQPSLYKDKMTDAELSKLWFGKSFCSKRVGWFRHVYADVPSIKNALDSTNSATVEVAHNCKVGLLNLDSILPKNEKIFTDDVHLTPYANRLIADEIFTYLLKSNFAIKHKLIKSNVHSQQ